MAVPATSASALNLQQNQALSGPHPALAMMSAALAAPSLSMNSTTANTLSTAGTLPPGLRCRYQSSRYGWLNCQVLRANPDGTYDLDVRQQAAAKKLAPLVDTASAGSLVWPLGSLVYYWSLSTGSWMPTEIASSVHADGTYDLSIREHAHPDRIRARAVSSQAQVPGTSPSPSVVHPQTVAATYTASMAQPLQMSQVAMNPFAATDVASFTSPISTVNNDAPIQPGNGLVTSAPPPTMPGLFMLPAGAQNAMVPFPTPQGETAVPAPTLPTIPSMSYPSSLPPPAGFSATIPSPIPMESEGDTAPSIHPIVHPGHAPRQDEELVGVIVTICHGASYDPVYNQIPQLAGEGKRVATYAASASSLKHILGELSGRPVQSRRSSSLHRNLRHLASDVQAVQSDSVVFNWECCAGCSGENLHDCSTVMDLVKHLLDRGHMVMFSDFSLKALISNWREDLLGPNPFVKTAEFGGQFQLRFDPAILGACPSAQLQKLGELASNGKADLHALPSTIAFSVRWSKADCSAYNCKVLTVMTELNGGPACPVAGEGCEVGGHRGLAGHVLVTYPSGGQLLASAGHWIELSRLDVTEASLMQAAAAFGTAFQSEVEASLGSCSTAVERNRTVQSYSSQIIQQSSPCSYSMPPSASRRSTPTDLPRQPRSVPVETVL